METPQKAHNPKRTIRPWSEVLERNGWKRAVAGEADFLAGVHACETMYKTPDKGIIAAGNYGAGKTAFLAAVTAQSVRHPLYRVDLGMPHAVERLTENHLKAFAVDPYRRNVFLDDLGAESTVNDYGVKIETVADFVVGWHAWHDAGTRLFITTNLTAAEIDERYGGRFLSRLKDLCIPVHFSGKDKRAWTR